MSGFRGAIGGPINKAFFGLGSVFDLNPSLSEGDVSYSTLVNPISFQRFHYNNLTITSTGAAQITGSILVVSDTFTMEDAAEITANGADGSGVNPGLGSNSSRTQADGTSGGQGAAQGGTGTNDGDDGEDSNDRDFLTLGGSGGDGGPGQTGGGTVGQGGTSLFRLGSFGNLNRIISTFPDILKRSFIFPSTASNGQDVLSLAGGCGGGGGSGNTALSAQGGGGGAGGGVIWILANRMVLGECFFRARGGNGGTASIDAGGGGGGGGGAVILITNDLILTGATPLIDLAAGSGGFAGGGGDLGEDGQVGYAAIYHLGAGRVTTSDGFGSLNVSSSLKNAPFS